MSRATLEVAGIFRQYGQQYRMAHKLPLQQSRVMRAIESCRTSALGGHVDRCNHCHQQRISYNSCRNRHCPKCQNVARAEWVEKRKAELLPIDYYHLVFTISSELNNMSLQNKEAVYKLLFDASAETLLTIAADPKHLGAKIGFFSVLHTWGQNLLHHPHVHSVVTGGGLSSDGSTWVPCRPGFFLSVRVLSRLFRRLFLEGMHRLYRQGKLRFQGQLAGTESQFPSLLRQLAKKEWVVYAKPPFGGPVQVIEYLGRYTHRVAISNQRLLAVHSGNVTFQYKDYRSKHRQKSRQMTVAADEFIHRFLMHTLPPGFARIRHYGLLAGRNKQRLLPLCGQFLDAETPLPTATEMAHFKGQMLSSSFRCGHCGIGEMIRSERLPCRVPYRSPWPGDTS